MRLLVYADVNLNLIDGSTIWVQSLLEVLRLTYPTAQLTLVSRETLTGVAVGGTLSRDTRIDIQCCDPALIAEARPSAGAMATIVCRTIADLHAKAPFDRIIVRSTEVAQQLARNPELTPKVWAYLLQSPSLTSADDSLEEVVQKLGGLIVQTDAQRALLEALLPAACNKTSVLPPMITVIDHTQPVSANPNGEGVRFLYSGKYSKSWNVEAFFDIPAACAAAGVKASVTLIGDKVHREPDDLDFRPRILRKFKETQGVVWLGAMERDATVAEAVHHDLGLCWRTDALNDSLEISTKFLEFASQGVPAVVNRTAAYEDILGADYPYFAENMQDVVLIAAKVAADPGAHLKIREQMRRVSRDYTYNAASSRLKYALHLDTSGPALTRKVNVRIASHDLKFLDVALERLEDSGRYAFQYDMQETSGRYKIPVKPLPDADVIFCEWCSAQAVWYSKNKRPNQRLYIRLHRFEAFTDLPKDINISAVDGIIVVSDYFRDLCVRKYGWPREKLVVIPQYCMAEQFRRPKNPGYETTLGLVGMNDSRKHPDRALDILKQVRRQRPEFRLRIRSTLPWGIGWVWNKPQQRAYYEALFRRIESDPDLKGAVIFDRPGPNMAEWYRNIGYLLSTSESEGCHTSVAEALCSGSRASVINWDGARTLYDAYVDDTPQEMAAAILRRAESPLSAAEMRDLQDESAQMFDISRTLGQLRHWFG